MTPKSRPNLARCAKRHTLPGVLPLDSCHATHHTGIMTYRHMNQTEPCNRPQCWCNRPDETTDQDQDQPTRYRVQYPDDEGWTRTTTVAGGMIHRMGY